MKYLLMAVFLSLGFWACESGNGPGDNKPGVSSAHLEQLLFNSKWYRSYDSTNTIIPAEGTLLFAWSYVDTARRPDSFYVGIDTLWALPQDLEGDTANDWDLQVCPDLICMNGLKAGVHGSDAPFTFGGTGDYSNPDYVTEHHFQFFPAVSLTHFHPIAPEGGVFGAMMFVRSRSLGKADTVFGFGAWKMEWDSAYPPPVRPVGGYLPKRSDFTIVNNKVRYIH